MGRSGSQTQPWFFKGFVTDIFGFIAGSFLFSLFVDKKSQSQLHSVNSPKKVALQ